MHKRLRCFGWLIVFSAALQLAAQTPPGLKLLGIAVQGNKTISEHSIKIQSGLMEGKAVNQEDVAQAIQRLWKLNLFSDVKVLLDKDSDEGIFIIIQVEEYPRLGKFEVRGNKKIRKSKFDEELNLISGKVLTASLLTEIKRKVRNLYTKEGFLLAEVETELRGTPTENTRDLILNIREGKRVRIKAIRFSGNRQFSAQRLRRVLKETHQRNLFILRTGEYDQKKFTEDKDKLRAFYRKEGYRDFQVLNDTITYTENKKRMFIDFKVYEGPRYKYASINFSGNTLFTDEQLQNVLRIKAGDWYNEEELQKGLYDRINGAYMDRGYLFFQVNPLEVPVADDAIALTLDITENHQVAVNQIHIYGNSRTYENVIRRELKIFPGEIFSREALIRSQREVFILNYFANVTPDVVPVSDKAVDVELTVEEKSSGRANMSFSISQMYGLIGGGGFEFNNFLGRGQQLAISYQQGTQYSVVGSGTNPYKSISLSFTEPWLFDTPNLVGASFYYSERGGSTGYYSYPFDLNMMGGSLRWGRRFRWPDNYFRGSWMLSAAKKEYTNFESEAYLETVLQGQSKTTGISLTQVISRDSRDRPEFPTMGSVMSWTSTLSGGVLGGTEHFHKHLFSIEYYLPAIWKFVLYNHAEFGVIKKLRASSIIPPDERFIMGGAGMIYGTALRGYDDNQVGPMNPASSYPYGGETLFKYTLEYRFPISDNPTIYALTFAEAGNAWKTLKMTDPFDLKRSVGFGVRFFMPAMGMLGIDFGYGFDDIDAKGTTGYGKPEGWKTHFIFGMPY